jgi:curved DNA-binding protein CbpA
MTTHLLESDVMNACRTLFGPGPDIGRGFLFYLQPRGAKSAYRKKAKETHPDFYQTEGMRIQEKQAALFRNILEAYDIINRFFKERENGLWMSPAASVDFKPGAKKNGAQKSSTNTYKSPNPARKHNSNDYYRGPMPARVLEFGRYLYYSGRISYRSLIDALAWQRMQRPPIGNVALRWGWLAKGSIDRIVAQGAAQGRFGEKAVSLGLLSDFQVKTLLFYQRTRQERLGQYFVLNNILSAEQLDLLVNQLNEHNALAQSRQKKARRESSFA